jgi:hypothetical protein
MRYLLEELNNRYAALENAMEAETRCQAVDRKPWTATRISAEGSVDALEQHITNPPYGGSFRLYRCQVCGNRVASKESEQVVSLPCYTRECQRISRTHQRYEPKAVQA